MTGGERRVLALENAASDIPDKRERMRAVLDIAGADGVWLTSPTSLSWLLEGARLHTSLLGPPVAAALVRRESTLIRVYSNEYERLVAEELPRGVVVEPIAWHDALVDPGAPGDVRSEESLAAPLRSARAVLLPAERSRFEALGRETAEVLTRVIGQAHADETERRLAARITAALTEIGADPVVVMVSGDSRLRYRHPLPTDAPLGRRAMVVVCARRHGLIANVTRWVRFGPATADELARTAAILRVEAAYFRATRPGRTLGEVLTEGAAAYATEGLAGDEWTRHHQGGAAGYAGRDPRATPGATDVVHDGQAFAWNPTAPGAKIEDTVIIENGEVVVLTYDDAWPTLSIDGVDRPDELEL